MSKNVHRIGLLIVSALLTLGCGCVDNRADGATQNQDRRIIPLTTDSKEAAELFRQGQDSFYKLRPVKAQRKFKDAVQADPNFAMGYWMLSNTTPSATGIFANIERAVELSKHASKPERLLILAAHANFLGESSSEERYLKELVGAAPDDPRSHFSLASFYFNQQRFDRAIERFEAAVAVDPDFFPAYNLMGYAYRALERNAEAETAYKKYIELLPEEANPLDSFAEFLMKAGRFEESIDAYRGALEQNPDFVPSIVGIANNYMFLDMPEQARSVLRELLDRTRIDVRRRQALFWIAASYIYEGAYESVPAVLEQRMEIGKRLEDGATLAQDLRILGRFYLETSEPAKALVAFEKARMLIADSELPDEVKQGTDRRFLFQQAMVALNQGKIGEARKFSERYQAQVEPRQIPSELRLHYELEGRLLMAEGQYKSALHRFGKANQQDPMVLMLSAQAAQADGDLRLAQDYAERTANFNGLSFYYGFVRKPAERLLRDLN